MERCNKGKGKESGIKIICSKYSISDDVCLIVLISFSHVIITHGSRVDVAPTVLNLYFGAITNTRSLFSE